MSLFKLSALGSLVSTTISRLTAQPLRPLINSQSVRFFKDKDVLRLRCRDCYFTKVDERWHVLCRTHGRHKQRERIEDIKKKWIVTHMTIGHRPFQKKEEAYICNLAPPGPYDYRHKLVNYTEKFGPMTKSLRSLQNGVRQRLRNPWSKNINNPLVRDNSLLPIRKFD